MWIEVARQPPTVTENTDGLSLYQLCQVYIFQVRAVKPGNYYAEGCVFS